MTVRVIRRPDRKSGAMREFLMVDVTVKLADGTKERIREVPTDQTKRGAHEFERQLIRETLEGRRPKPGAAGTGVVRCPTFTEFWPRFLQQYVRSHNRDEASKADIYKSHLQPFFGDYRLDRITGAMVDEFKAHQLATKTLYRKPFSKKSINNHLTVLRKALLLAKDWKLISELPMIRQFSKLPAPEFDFFSFEETERLIEAAKSDPTWSAMIVVALKAGLRRGELRALRRRDLDFDRRMIHVRQALRKQLLGQPKGGKARAVEMSEDASTALKLHLAATAKRKSDYVFCHPTGRHFTEPETKQPFVRAATLAGLGGRGMWHVLRHTFCSHLVMRGIPLRVVQVLAGHASYATTERYAHLSPEIRGEAVRVLDAPKKPEQRQAG